MKKIGFIGCGNIATAIINGAISGKVIKAEDIYCFDVDEKKSNEFLKLGAGTTASAKELVGLSDVVFLTVKPQIIPDVVKQIATVSTEDKLFITPAAGVKIAKIKELLGFDAKVIRVMPNTPLTYLAGATAMVKGQGVTEEEFTFAKNLFCSCGVTAEVTEDKIDAITGISGSSPAFFMRFAREIILEGVRQGLNEEQAKELVVQTMAGTAKMVQQSPKTIDELICAVASPNGTTEAGLKTMDSQSFDRITAEVISSAINRSKELSK